MGADAVGFGSAAEIALGCRACMACQRGECAYGITSQDPRMRARLDPEEGARRLSNFVRVTVEEIKILTMLAGHADIRDLSEEDLRALDLNTAAITGLKLIGFERRLPWWDNPAVG
jgi:glutamate synthase domain-containing protein 2